MAAFCNPADGKIFTLSGGKYRSTKQHLTGWMRAIRDAGAVPGLLEMPTLPVSAEQLDALFDEFLRLPDVVA